jgi:sulfite exporter TauE/SafE/copper chaperone CopZ
MKPQEEKFKVSGMHCASCEILIEKKLLELPCIKAIEASAGKGEVWIEYEGTAPKIDQLNEIFKDSHYIFSIESLKEKRSNLNDWLLTAVVVLFVILGFSLVKYSGMAGLININSSSSLPIFFLFGLLAGISTCAALVGGIILSLSKQWAQEKLTPHLLFNIGRLISYTVFGGLLGLLGQKIQLSPLLSAIIITLVSLAMIAMGLQMLGVNLFRGFFLTMPKFLTRRLTSDHNFKNMSLPFLLGASTFLLPCGFTLTAESLALLSSSPVQGALIMGTFVLGTLIPLLLIGLASVKFYQNQHLAPRFAQVAGVLVLFFALFNINSQLDVLGLPSLSDFRIKSIQDKELASGLPPIINGKQVIKMAASPSGYQPNYFKVKVGVPVRWEITDTGTSGCTKAVISRSLFSGQIDLTYGQVSVKEFTPSQVGRFKFSCWMGMVSGVIEVVDSGGTQAKPPAQPNTIESSEASGCGCGGNK